MPLGCQWSNILSTLMMSLLPWTTSCLISLGLLSSGVLILGSPLLSSLRFIISSLGLLVILFDLSLICTSFFWSVVHFCMPLLLMLLLAFLIFLFVLWLSCIGVVLLLMLCSSLFLFIGFFVSRFSWVSRVWACTHSCSHRCHLSSVEGCSIKS